jgi:hypothetical protein
MTLRWTDTESLSTDREREVADLTAQIADVIADFGPNTDPAVSASALVSCLLRLSNGLQPWSRSPIINALRELADHIDHERRAN